MAGSAGAAAGQGASAGTGGAPIAGAGGASTAGQSGSAAAGTSGATGGCTITVTPSMSSVVPTVGIVEWSTSLASVESATIEFGLDETYGMSAPVDRAEPAYRTLLLGMKARRTYHFRVVATSGGTTCASADSTLTTGAAPNGVPAPSVDTADASRLYGGYLLTARWGTPNSRGPAFILDADGDLVWWYSVQDDAIRVRKSFDGKHLWIRNTAQQNGGGVVTRVSLDGLDEQSWSLPNTTHDLAVTPDGKLGLIGHASNGCDEILEFDPVTELLRPVFLTTEASGLTDCHVNFLAYYAADDTYVYSDWRDSAFVKITRQGEIVWILNGPNSMFTGTDWTYNHGIHNLGLDHLLVFSNNATGADSEVYELSLDLTSMVATTTWAYPTGEEVAHGGDVQRVENGNTIVTLSTAGVIKELGADHSVLQTLTWPIGTPVSYSEKVESLYGGPPPRIY
jgi:hypothetical protein